MSRQSITTSCEVLHYFPNFYKIILKYLVQKYLHLHWKKKELRKHFFLFYNTDILHTNAFLILLLNTSVVKNASLDIEKKTHKNKLISLLTIESAYGEMPALLVIMWNSKVAGEGKVQYAATEPNEALLLYSFKDYYSPGSRTCAISGLDKKHMDAFYTGVRMRFWYY